MDHKVPYGSCDSSLDLFIYTYFSFLNGAPLEPYRIFCIWSIFLKLVSNSSVFRECFTKQNFGWHISHLWTHWHTPDVTLQHHDAVWEEVCSSWSACSRPCVFRYEFGLSQLWHDFLCSSSTSHQIAPCRRSFWQILLESWLGSSKNTFLGWIKMWSFAYDVTHMRIDATFKRLKLRQGDQTSTAGDEGCCLSSGLHSPLFPGRKL